MVQLASASHAMPVADRSEPRPWLPGPTFATLERALDLEDVVWCGRAGGNAAIETRLRRHRRRVVSVCVADLRQGARLLMDEWRRQAAARGDYGGADPLLQMAAIHLLLLGVEALATWTLTLGMPRPQKASHLLNCLKDSVALAASA